MKRFVLLSGLVVGCSSSESTNPTPAPDASTASDSAAPSDASTSDATGGSGRRCLITQNNDGVTPSTCREYSAGWVDAELAKDCASAKGNLVASCPSGEVAVCKGADANGLVEPQDIKLYPAGPSSAFKASCSGQGGTYEGP